MKQRSHKILPCSFKIFMIYLWASGNKKHHCITLDTVFIVIWPLKNIAFQEFSAKLDRSFLHKVYVIGFSRNTRNNPRKLIVMLFAAHWLVLDTRFTNSQQVYNSNFVEFFYPWVLSGMTQSSHKFAHVMTALLSWHVQNCDLIWSLFNKLEQHIFPTRFGLWAFKTLVKRICGHPFGVAEGKELLQVII